MKKIFILSSFAILILQSCSSGSTDNNSNNSYVTDIDGNIYSTIIICNKKWTQTNLNVSHYRNGDVIPQVTNPIQWANLTTGAWCYYNNDSSNGAVYGKLYNWYAVNDSRGLAPDGWHIPTDSEWISLTSCIGGVGFGGKLKETGNAHWISPNTEATNSSGFTALPAGQRSFYDGTFSFLQSGTAWWSSTEAGNSSITWTRGLVNFWGTVSRNDMYKGFGISVRCVKN